MKTLKFLLLCLLVGVCFLSCAEDDSEEPIEGLALPVEGTLLDGGRISGVDLYCREYDREFTGKSWETYCAETKTVQDYDDFFLNLMIHKAAYRYTPHDTSEMSAIARLEKEYEKKKSQFILDGYNEYKNSGLCEPGWPVFFTAYTNDEVTVTCDKTLYGEEPGTNLSSYFTILPDVCPCLAVGKEDSKLLYRFGEELPTRMSDLFVVGCWLSPDYILTFAEKPSEKPDELTLYLSLPITKEYIWEYAVEKYRGNNPSVIYSDSVYKAECKIKFEWD